jgi:hypothetical protein
LDGWMDGWLFEVGSMIFWIDGWMDGWLFEVGSMIFWMDGWMTLWRFWDIDTYCSSTLHSLWWPHGSPLTSFFFFFSRLCEVAKMAIIHNNI